MAAVVELTEKPSLPTLGKPRMRGWSHLGAFFVWVWLGLRLCSAAAPGNRGASLAFVCAIGAMFGVSAIYHLPHWTRRARLWVGRLDQSTIFVAVLGTYIPFVHALGPQTEPRLLGLACTGALIGSTITVFWPNAPKPVASALYVLYGSMAALFLPELRALVGWTVIVWIVAGALFYACGAITFAVRRPNPWPTVFGYHEIFHLFVIAGALCHYVAVGILVARS